MSDWRLQQQLEQQVLKHLGWTVDQVARSTTQQLEDAFKAHIAKQQQLPRKQLPPITHPESILKIKGFQIDSNDPKTSEPTTTTSTPTTTTIPSTAATTTSVTACSISTSMVVEHEKYYVQLKEKLDASISELKKLRIKRKQYDLMLSNPDLVQSDRSVLETDFEKTNRMIQKHIHSLRKLCDHITLSLTTRKQVMSLQNIKETTQDCNNTNLQTSTTTSVDTMEFEAITELLSTSSGLLHKMKFE